MNSHIPSCQYMKTDGRQCGSPSLKTKRYCYFHYEVNRAVAHLDIPPLEDGNAIQLALTDLARAIVEDRIALKPAALLAYILQTASANLKRVQLGVFPDRMITELPALDPYSRGLAPLPGERNRDPEPAAPESAPEGRPRIAQSVSPGTGSDEGIPTALPEADVSEGHDFNRAGKAVPMTSSTLPTAGAQVAGATAAPKKFPSAVKPISATRDSSSR